MLRELRLGCTGVRFHQSLSHRSHSLLHNQGLQRSWYERNLVRLQDHRRDIRGLDIRQQGGRRPCTLRHPRRPSKLQQLGACDHSHPCDHSYRHRRLLCHHC
jgi:hypothetical protein